MQASPQYEFEPPPRFSTHTASLCKHIEDVFCHTEKSMFQTGGECQRDPAEAAGRPRSWVISLTELLCAIQLYNAAGYHYCPIDNTEDDFCPGFA